MTKNRIFPIPPAVKETFRKFAEEVTGWQVKDTNIKKIKVHAFSSRIKKQIDSEILVGEEIDANISNTPHEPVMAIFEAKDEFLVVTPNINDQKGTIYLFQPNEIISIEKEG